MSFLEDYGQSTNIVEYNGAWRMRYTHVHPHYELCFCVDDIEQLAVINDVEYVYKYPSVIISSPYTLHSMSSIDTSTDRYERHILYFGDKTLANFNDELIPKELFQGNTGILFQLTVDEAQELKKMLQLYSDRSTDAERELIFAIFINRLMALCPSERITKISARSFYIQNVLQYISENFSGIVDISDISRQFSVSRSKLDRDFKRYTGITVHNYVEMCRLNQAKYMLEYRSDVSISDIAKMCGFKSENYFFPFFKKMEGITPTAFRKLHSI